jgi:hypothetical protein
MLAFPGHRGGKMQDRLDRVQEVAIPVLFQTTPTAFNRVVFTVIGGIVGQLQGDPRLLDERNQTIQKLGASTMALWSIVQIENQGLNLREADFVGLPPVQENVHQAIAGHLGSDPIERQFVVFGEQQSHGCQQCLRVKIMVGGMDLDPVLARAGVSPDLHGGLGIQADPKRCLLGIGLLIDLAQGVEDGVGLGNLFFGKLFCTVLGWYPKRLSLRRIPSSQGSWASV